MTASPWVPAILLSVVAFYCVRSGVSKTGALSILTLGCYSTIYLVLPMMVQSQLNEYPLAAAAYSEDDQARGGYLLVLALSATIVGYLPLRGSKGAGIEVPGLRQPALTRPGLKTERQLTLLLAWFSAAAFALLLGPDSFYISRELVNERIVSLIPSSLAFQGIVRVAFYIPVMMSAIESGRLLRLGRSKLEVVAYLIPMILVVNIINAPRYWFFAGAVAWAITRWWLPSRRSIIWSVALLVGFAVLVLPLADFARRAERSSPVQVSGPINALASDGDFSQYQQHINGLTYVDVNGLALGSQMLGEIFVFVPRSIWSSKATDTGRLIQGSMSNVNPSASPWLVGYVDFGWPGVAAVGFALGHILRRLDKSLRRSALSGEPPNAWIMASLGLLPIVFRGSVGTAVASYAGLGFVALCIRMLATVQPDLAKVPSERFPLA